MSNTTITQTINYARQSRKNIFVFGETLTMQYYQSLLSVIQNNKNRCRFFFNDCQLTEDTMSVLDKLFQQDIDIDALLFNNVLFHDIANAFRIISKAKGLAILSFKNSHLVELDSKVFTETLQSFPYLTSLSVSSERCGENFFNETCTALCNHQYLKDFQWSDSTIGDDACFATFFRSCPNLHNLNFAQIALTNEWIKTLEILLDENWKIEVLTCNHIYDPLRNKSQRNADRAKLKLSAPSYNMFNLVQNVTKDF